MKFAALDPIRRTLVVRVALGAAIATIFLVDLGTPLGLGIPFLYLLVALAAIAARVRNLDLAILAALCTVLALAKLLLPSMDGVVAFGQGNRLIFSVLLWALVGLELTRRKMAARARTAQQKLSQELERMVQERTDALHQANAALVAEVAERQQAERTILEYADRLHALAGQLVEAQEVERTYLAAELHDRIGQNLSALNINLNLNLAQLSTLLPATGDPVRARIKDSLELLERTTEVVRGVMEELHPALLDQYGLDTALHWYGNEFAGRTGIRVAQQASEGFPRLLPKVEMTLFRIVQEALTNVAKHAAAEAVTLALARTAAGIRLTVADDGAGMDAARAATRAETRPVGSGWGVSIMAERARAVGGDFQIDSVPDDGTRIVVTIANGLWEPDDDHHRIDR